MNKDLIERVARAIHAAFMKDLTCGADHEAYAKAALRALKPGDEVGEGTIYLESTMASAEAHAARQAAAEMREACAAYLEERAKTFAEPFKTVGLVQASAIRAMRLPGDKN